MSLRLDWCGHDAAKYAVENWHYSECMPSGKLVKIGVWEDSKFIGCVIYGLGATPNLAKSFDMKMTECCELTRVALTNHITPVSKILAISLKMLRRFCPGLKLVVSFADSAQGHHGGIYQATNWIFTGSALLDCWIIKGQKIHPRSVVAKYGSQSMATVKKIDPDAKKVWGYKHRYVMPLDSRTRSIVQKLGKPYPKRAGSKVNVATVHHTVEGGVIPTPALHPQDISDE